MGLMHVSASCCIWFARSTQYAVSRLNVQSYMHAQRIFFTMMSLDARNGHSLRWYYYEYSLGAPVAQALTSTPDACHVAGMKAFALCSCVAASEKVQSHLAVEKK